MIPISQKRRREIEENDFYRECCHIGRPGGHECKKEDRIQQEHPYSRGKRGEYADIVVPVCSSLNYSPDKITRAWSKKIALERYEKELKEILTNFKANEIQLKEAINQINELK